METLKKNNQDTDKKEQDANKIGQNPFDPASLRLGNNFGDAGGTEKLITTIPVRKPYRQEFVRTHPEEIYRLDAAIVEYSEDKENYLVTPECIEIILGEITPVTLYTTITRQNVLMLWPVKMPKLEGRYNSWNESSKEAAIAAKTRWIRVASNQSLGAYEIFQAARDLSEPQWPSLEMAEILEIAFKGRFVNTPDHPIIKKLQGYV